MADPIRLQIIDKIEELAIQNLNRISGYNFDYEFSKNYRDIDQISYFPSVCLLIGASDYSLLTNQEYTAGKNSNSQDDGWIISVVVYSDSGSNQIEIFEKVNQDIIRFLINTDFSSVDVISTTLIHIAELFPVPDDDSKIINQLNFSIKYDFIKTAP